MNRGEFNFYIPWQGREAAVDFNRETAVGIVRRACEENYLFAGVVLGENNSVTKVLRAEVDKAPSYVESTRRLIEDSVRSGMVGRCNTEEALKRVAYYDHQRVGRLEAVDAVCCALMDWEAWANKGVVDVPYRYGYNNYSFNGSFSVGPMFGDKVFGYSGGGREPFFACKDPRVPATFVYADSVRYNSAYDLPMAVDIVAALMSGKRLPVGRNDTLGNFELSERVKLNFNKLNFIVFYNGNYFCASRVRLNGDFRVVAVSLYGQPWIVNGVSKDIFRSWVVPSFVHEVRHVEDYGNNDGSPLSCCLTEMRAFSDEGNVLQATRATEEAVRRTYGHYHSYEMIVLGRGFPSITHIEDNLLDRIIPRVRQMNSGGKRALQEFLPKEWFGSF